MNILQTGQMVFRSLWLNKIRFAQVVLGMVVGVAAVVSVLIEGPYMYKYYNKLFAEYACPDLLQVTPLINVDRKQHITLEDMQQLAAENPDYIRGISPHVNFFSRLRYEDKTLDTMAIIGIDENYMGLVPCLSINEGRFFQTMDISRERRVCVIGAYINEKLMDGDALGKKLRLYGEDYTVIGVMDKVEFDFSFNLTVFVPYTLAQKMIGERTTPNYDYDGIYYIDNFYMRANGVENIGNARIALENMLTERFGPMGPRWQLHCVSYRYMQSSSEGAVYDWIICWCSVGVIILIVGGVGIANVMLAAVKQRTKEIGIRKAFGASSRDIKRQFLLESIFISLLGGVFGIVAGLLKNYQIILSDDLEVLFMPVLVGLAFALLVGLLAGNYPATQAAKMEPVAAINID